MFFYLAPDTEIEQGALVAIADTTIDEVCI